MQTRQELIDWLALQEKICIDLQYILIDSLNYPEIDTSIRALRGIVWDFEQSLNEIKECIKLQQQYPEQFNTDKK